LALFLTVSNKRPLIAEQILLEIVVKPLQRETWLLLTVYRKSPLPYPMAPSSTP